VLGRVPDYFTVARFQVSVERRYNSSGDLVTFSEATVKIIVDGQELISAAEGDGPVNALDRALRKDLGRYQCHIAQLRLSDFRVRIFEGGTDAVTRVLIESTDETGESWTTVGVSANIIDASFQALTDSIVYKLMRDGVA
jgi:2-isopropylmalate synthase